MSQEMALEPGEIDLLVDHCVSRSMIDGVIKIELDTTYAVERLELHTAEPIKLATAYRPSQWKFWTMPAGGCLVFPCSEVVRSIEISSSASLVADSIRVFSTATALATTAFKNKFKLNPSFLQNHSVFGAGDVQTIRVQYIGDLGNYVIQIVNAIAIAKTCGIANLELFEGSSIRVPDYVEFEGLKVKRYEPGRNTIMDGTLWGPVFRPVQFGSLLKGFSASEAVRIAVDFVAPVLLPSVAAANDLKFSDEVTVHLRAGDIFKPGFKGGHGQPPLAYYRLAIRDRMRSFGLKRVRLVYQDLGNPLVAALKSEFDSEGLEYRCQSSDETTDFAALVNAEHLVVGFSGFAHAAAMMSDRILSVSYFEHSHPYSMPFEHIPAVSYCYYYFDSEGGYPHPRDWRNSENDISRLLTYPATGIRMRTAADANLPCNGSTWI